MLATDIALYVASFFAIWFGTGLIVRSIDGFSRKLKISQFAISFFVLGILTSIPEMAVGVTSIAERRPGIVVGALLGGIIVIFFLVIPLMAIIGKGLKLGTELSKTNLLFTFAALLLPMVYVLDKKITSAEAIFSILVYVILFFLMQRKDGILDNSNHKLMKLKSYSLIDLFKTIAGVGLVFASSQIIVQKTIVFSEIFRVSPFVISLIFLSVGTNLPELSLGIRSILSRKKDIAFGDYVGSAAANTAILGVMVLLNGGEIQTETNFKLTLTFALIGLGAFYYFAKSHRDISRKEGLALLIIYVAFVLSEVLLRDS